METGTGWISVLGSLVPIVMQQHFGLLDIENRFKNRTICESYLKASSRNFKVYLLKLKGSSNAIKKSKWISKHHVMLISGI